MNKLVHEYNSYSRSTGKKPADADYFALTENIVTNLKSPKFKVGDRVRITKYKNIFSKGYTENWSKEIYVIDSMLKTNPWPYDIKYSNREKIIGSLYENELLLSKLYMSYYPEPERQSSRHKVKVVLDLSSYATKKQLDHSTAVDTSDLAVKKDFVALKAEIDKLDINKLVNVTTSLNNLKT